MRVLVADDDRSTRSLLKLYLSKWGYEADLASDGNEAWELFTAHHYDIVLSDWLMPGLKGPELCRRIRALQRGSYTYVILCTVNGETHNVVSGIEAGADDYVIKPFVRDELKARLDAGRRLVEQQRALSDTNDKLTSVLRQAADTLENMLPVPRSGPDFRLSWLFRPSTYLGGDIFNTFMIDESHTGVYAIDVCGHGVSSALFAVSLRNMLLPGGKGRNRAEAIGMLSQADFCDPVKVATALNHFFSSDHQADDAYFTMFYGVIDHRDRSMRWVRAGHPPPIVVGHHTRLLEDGDQPIGLFSEVSYCEHKAVFEPGDRLFVYSDGITEAMNPAHELFGTDRLSSVLTGAKDATLEDAVGRVNTAVLEHQQRSDFADDISLIAVEIV